MLVAMLALAAIAPGKSAAADKDIVPLSFHFLADADPSAPFHSVCCGELSLLFSQEPVDRYRMQQGHLVHWIKVAEPVPPGYLDFGLILDDLTLFVRNPDTGLVARVARAGDQLDDANREVRATHAAFHVFDADAGHEFYIRFVQERTAQIRPRWVSITAFESRETNARVLHAAFSGASVIMMLFNIALGVLVRQKLFLFFALSVAALLVANLYYSGIGPAYVWSDHAGLSNLIYDASAFAGLVFTCLFAYDFLKGEGPGARLVRWILVPIALAIPVYALVWFLPGWLARFLMSLTIATGVLAIAAVTVLLALRRHRNAQRLLPTLMLVSLPAVALIIMSKTADPLWDSSLMPMAYTIPGDHVFELVMFFDALLVSLLLAYRIRVSHLEAAQKALELNRLQSGISQRLLEVVDAERRRFASELHDTAGQGLLAIAARLKHLVGRQELSDEQADMIGKAADHSMEVVDEIRRISHELHPAIIDHLGWKNAVEELFVTLEESTGIETELRLDVPEDALDRTQKLNFYRIIQELVSNVAKHSGASYCEARFVLANGRVEGEMMDNGSKLLPDKEILLGGSLGHAIIQQRLATLKGHWHLDSNENHTTVHVSFPVNGKARAEGGKPSGRPGLA